MWPDGYGVLALPHRAPLHLLLELDRATEPASELRDKATRYAKAIPRNTLARHRPVVILAVPNSARAQVASRAVAGTGAPIMAGAWGKAADRSPLAIVISTMDAVGDWPVTAVGTHSPSPDQSSRKCEGHRCR